MNEIQALNILTDLANRALKVGVFKDIQDSGSVYTALLLFRQRLPVPEPATGKDGKGETEE